MVSFTLNEVRDRLNKLQTQEVDEAKSAREFWSWILPIFLVQGASELSIKVSPSLVDGVYSSEVRIFNRSQLAGIIPLSLFPVPFSEQFLSAAAVN